MILFIEKKYKTGKRLKSNCSTTRNLRNPDIVDITLAIIDHPKTFDKLSKNIRQAEKVSKVGNWKNYIGPLYSETKKNESFLD